MKKNIKSLKRIMKNKKNRRTKRFRNSIKNKNIKNIKARLFIVNAKTLEETKDKMEVSVILPNIIKDEEKKEKRGKWDKSVIYIISDMLQIKIGDYIFLWVTKGEKEHKNRIYGVYRAISKPYYRFDGGDDPIKIKIELAYKFDEPIYEYDVINNYQMKNFLWTIIGKKIAGKSRASTPITNTEMDYLIKMLIEKNKEYEFYPFKCSSIKNKFEKDEIRIELNLNEEYKKQDINELCSFEIKEILKQKQGNKVPYEKSLEAIINMLFTKEKGDEILQLDIDINDVIWYANYLPYGIERSEIDYLVIESKDKVVNTRINVIELMRDNIDIDHIERSLLYARWIKDSVAQGIDIVRPLLICGYESKITDKIKNKILTLDKESNVNSIEIYKYEIICGTIKFIKIWPE